MKDITEKLIKFIKTIPDKHLQVEALEDAMIFIQVQREHVPCKPLLHTPYYELCMEERRQATYMYVVDKYKAYVPLNSVSEASKD